MKSLNQIHVICFDFDGTIADTMPFLTEIAVKIIGKYYGVREDLAHTRYVETTGLPFERQIDIIFPQHPKNGLAVQEFEQMKHDNYFRLEPVPHIKRVLTALKARDYQLAISSSTIQPLVTEYVKRFDLPCDLALGNRAHFSKGRDHFQYIMDTFHAACDQLCYIGDSLNDYRVAGENQIHFIGKSGLFTIESFHQLHPDIVVIHEMDDLLTLF